MEPKQLLLVYILSFLLTFSVGNTIINTMEIRELKDKIEKRSAEK